jgi:hypothetical protein
MSAETRDPQPYEAPTIEQRTAIDMPLIGRGSAILCAAFHSQ